MFAVSYGMMWFLVLIQAAIICILIHQVADLRNSAASHIDPLARGSTAPSFSAIDVRTQAVTQSSSLFGRSIVLCFLSTECND